RGDLSPGIKVSDAAEASLALPYAFGFERLAGEGGLPRRLRREKRLAVFQQARFQMPPGVLPHQIENVASLGWALGIFERRFQVRWHRRRVFGKRRDRLQKLLVEPDRFGQYLFPVKLPNRLPVIAEVDVIRLRNSRDPIRPRRVARVVFPAVKVTVLIGIEHAALAERFLAVDLSDPDPAFSRTLQVQALVDGTVINFAAVAECWPVLAPDVPRLRRSAGVVHE